MHTCSLASQLADIYWGGFPLLAIIDTPVLFPEQRGSPASLKLLRQTKKKGLKDVCTNAHHTHTSIIQNDCLDYALATYDVISAFCFVHPVIEPSLSWREETKVAFGHQITKQTPGHHGWDIQKTKGTRVSMEDHHSVLHQMQVCTSSLWHYVENLCCYLVIHDCVHYPWISLSLCLSICLSLSLSLPPLSPPLPPSLLPSSDMSTLSLVLLWSLISSSIKLTTRTIFLIFVVSILHSTKRTNQIAVPVREKKTPPTWDILWWNSLRSALDLSAPWLSNRHNYEGYFSVVYHINNYCCPLYNIICTATINFIRFCSSWFQCYLLYCDFHYRSVVHEMGPDNQCHVFW